MVNLGSRFNILILLGFGLILLILSHPLVSYSGQVNTKVGKEGMNVLRFPLGARAMGMGETGVALADDANGIYWNPAGLTQIKMDELALTHNEWFCDIRYDNIGYVQPMGESQGVLSLNATYLYIGNLDGRDKNGAPQGIFESDSLLFSVSYAYPLTKKLSFGTNLKLVQQTIDNEKAGAFAGDIGLLYELDTSLKLGLSCQNIGDKIKFSKEAKPFSLPKQIKIGIARKFLGDRLTWASELNVSTGKKDIHTGLEAWIYNLLALRAGYKYSFDSEVEGYSSGLRYGVGFRLGAYQVDYGYGPYGDLGDTHRLSVLRRFGERGAKVAIPPLAREPVPQEPSEVPGVKVGPPTLQAAPPVEEASAPPPVELPFVASETQERPPHIPSGAPSSQLPRPIIVSTGYAIIWDNPISPGTEYRPIDKLKQGTQLLLIDDSNKWYYKVELPDGTIGWVFSLFVTPVE